METYFIIGAVLLLIFAIVWIVKFKHVHSGWSLVCLAIGMIFGAVFTNSFVCRWAVEWTDILLVRLLIASLIWAAIALALAFIAFGYMAHKKLSEPWNFDFSDMEV